MDEHAEIFYGNLSSRGRTREWIDEQRKGPEIEERKQLRQKMKCQPFSWFWNVILNGVMDMYKVFVENSPHNITLVDTVVTPEEEIDMLG